jgi:hypothetical protein
MFKFKGLLIGAVALVVFVSQVAADEAMFTPQVPKGVHLPFRYYARYREFTRPGEDAGTVSPHAVMAVLEGPIRFAVAIDSSTADVTQPDVVRFDFTGQGRFTDAATIPLTITRQERSAMTAKVGPAVIKVPVDGDLVEATVWGEYEKDGPSYRSLKIGFDRGLQGRCDFGQRGCTVCIVDGTGDLRVTSAFKPVTEGGKVKGRTAGDTLMIDTGDGTFKDASKVIRVAYGQPVWMDGAWYDVKVGDDGKSLSVQRVDLPTGHLKIANANWEMLLVSPERVMWTWSTQAGQAVPLPAGRYVVMRYKQYVEFANTDGGAILVEGPGPDQGHMDRIASDPVIDVPPDATVELAIGTPLTVKPEISKSGRDVRFSLKVTDASGRQPDYVEVAGRRSPEAKVRVLDAEGKEVYVGTMAYG